MFNNFRKAEKRTNPIIGFLFHAVNLPRNHGWNIESIKSHECYKFIIKRRASNKNAEASGVMKESLM